MERVVTLRYDAVRRKRLVRSVRGVVLRLCVGWYRAGVSIRKIEGEPVDLLDVWKVLVERSNLTIDCGHCKCRDFNYWTCINFFGRNRY